MVEKLFYLSNSRYAPIKNSFGFVKKLINLIVFFNHSQNVWFIQGSVRTYRSLIKRVRDTVI